MRGKNVGVDVLCGISLLLSLTAIAIDTWVTTLPVIRTVLVFVTLTVFPGGLVLLVGGFRFRSKTRCLVYSVGLSLVIVMGVGFVLNFSLPLFGYDRPLSLPALCAGFGVVFIGLLTSVRTLEKEVRTIRLEIPSLWEFGPFPFALLLIPAFTILSLRVLNAAQNNLPIVVVLGIISVVPLVVAFGFLPDRWYPLGVFSMALAVLYHKSLWQFSDFGGQAAVVRFWRLERWDPSMNGLLEHGTLFPIYARLEGISILTHMEVVNPPLISAVIPLIMFLTFRTFTTEKNAFLGASLFIFAHPFYLQYPSAGRAATPVLFLVLLGTVLTDPDLPVVQKRALGLPFAGCIVVTHYGTSYLVMISLFGAVAVLFIYSLTDSLLERINRLGPTVLQPRPELEEEYRSDGGREERNIPDRNPGHEGSDAVDDKHSERGSPVKDTILEAIHRVRDGTISLSFAIVFAILSSSWYMFTFDKKQFDALLQFVLNTVETFFGTTRIGGGSTASRLAADYGTISIAISKALYMIIAILAAIGFLWIYVRRFLSTEEVQIPDEYLALATVVFGIFSGTILIPGAWGGGRPLMIVFSLTTIFAVFGAIAIFVVGEAVLGRIWSSGVESVPARMIPANLGASSFASILMVLFLINTGVGVVGGLGDTAPSNVPVVDAQEDSFRETNIATHVWLVDHRSLDERIYGDRQVWAMLDWYAPQIAARQANISRPAYQIRPGSDHLQNLHSKGTRSGYVILHGENVINGRQKIVHREWRPIGNLSQEFQRRDQIFTTGQSAVLYANKTQSR